MNKELKQLKKQVEEILKRDNCHINLDYKDGCDVYTAESLEELEDGVIAVLLKSNVQTGTIRKAFKSSIPSYSIPKQTKEEIYNLLKQYGYEETDAISTGCYYQTTFCKIV